MWQRWNEVSRVSASDYKAECGRVGLKMKVSSITTSTFRIPLYKFTTIYCLVEKHVFRFLLLNTLVLKFCLCTRVSLVCSYTQCTTTECLFLDFQQLLPLLNPVILFTFCLAFMIISTVNAILFLKLILLPQYYMLLILLFKYQF